jgi:hypothetical protein
LTFSSTLCYTVNMKKICVKCNEEKDLDLFAKGKNYKDGRRGTCKRCHTDYVINYYNNNPDKKAEKIRMNSYYKPNWKRHNITEDKYKEMLDLYDGKCHSCNDNDAYCIDHDHSCCPRGFSCGKCVRGILCSQCNTALGLLSDSKDKIQNLIKYIS